MDSGQIFGGLLVLLLGLLLIAEAVRQRWLSIQARTWPACEGVISDVGIEESSDPESTTYQCYVEFDYFVHGRHYVGTRLGPGNWQFNSKATALASIEAYRRGYPATVYYNPDNPAQALLKREMPWGFFPIYLGMGIFLVVFAFAAPWLL